MRLHSGLIKHYDDIDGARDIGLLHSAGAMPTSARSLNSSVRAFNEHPSKARSETKTGSAHD